MIYDNEAKSANGKDAWAKSRRNQTQISMSPLPVESHKMYIMCPTPVVTTYV